MRSHAMMLCLFLVPAFLGCKKAESPKASPPPPAAKAPPPRPAVATPTRPGGPSAADMKSLLTEDKITRFATYQKEVSAVTTEAVGIGLSAYQKVGTDQKKMEKAVAGDDRTAKIAAASQAALRKSGLSQDEATKLSQVLLTYYSRLYAMERMFAGSGGAKATGNKPGPIEEAMAKVQKDEAVNAEAVRKEFGERYGEDALALVKKHEPEFFAITEKMMSAAMGAMFKKK